VPNDYNLYRYVFGVSRICLISPHPFLSLGEGIGVRNTDAEFAENKPAIRLPFSVGRYGLRITGNGPPGSLCVSAANKSLCRIEQVLAGHAPPPREAPRGVVPLPLFSSL